MTELHAKNLNFNRKSYSLKFGRRDTEPLFRYAQKLHATTKHGTEFFRYAQKLAVRWFLVEKISNLHDKIKLVFSPKPTAWA